MNCASILSAGAKIIAVSAALVLITIIACYLYVSAYSRPYIFDSIDSTPAQKAGLLLGTSKYLPGGKKLNPYFNYRIQAAADLHRSGRISYIIASGDNSNERYNEPRKMYEDLVRAGVPGSAIYLDFAGFRTLDSVVRGNRVFGQNTYIIISQKFHNERAVYIARSFGIETIAYNAKDVAGAAGLRTHLREFLARVAAVIDVAVLKRQPKFLGEMIPVGDELDGE